MEGAEFCSYWNRHYCGYRFAFPVCNASTKNIIHVPSECIIHSTPQNIVSDQGTNLTANKVHQWLHAMEFTGLTLFPTILKHLAL